ncbi:MAG: fumarylacetoacetate hydrolase family protein, partial [Alphaproteobacteria bacterium]|nr:fumarylacetoacetate hydrolase family protein [Alphaproteobacteria bacterium]
GVDLSPLMKEQDRDAIDLLARLSRQEIRDFVRTSGLQLQVGERELGLPVDLRDTHIAAGTNYAAHAEEATVEGGPFLFVKKVAPTGPFADIPLTSGPEGAALLDYEVELCLVALSPVDPAQGAEGMGLMMCNDVTDRDVLLHNIDPDEPESGKGFTDGKSAEGFLPVGTLLVVPENLKDFAEQREVRLSVNGDARQQSPVSLWIWGPDELLKQAMAQRDRVWTWRKGEASLPIEDGKVPGRTLVLAGTLDGTVFTGISFWTIISGSVSWLFGGWDKSLAENVIDNYVEAAREDRMYLQPGDRVSIAVEGLGLLENEVIEKGGER